MSSAPNDPGNLYAPPTSASGPPPAQFGVEPAEEKRIRKVVTVSLVLAGLGIASSALNLLGSIVTKALSPEKLYAGQPSAVQEMQTQLQEKMEDASMAGVGMVIMLVALAIEAYAAYVSYLAYKRQEVGRADLVSRALPILMGFTAFKLIWTLFITSRTFGVIEEFQAQFAQSIGTQTEALDAMKYAMIGGMILAGVFALLWNGGLIAIYAWCRKVLASPTAERYFSA